MVKGSLLFGFAHGIVTYLETIDCIVTHLVPCDHALNFWKEVDPLVAPFGWKVALFSHLLIKYYGKKIVTYKKN